MIGQFKCGKFLGWKIENYNSRIWEIGKEGNLENLFFKEGELIGRKIKLLLTNLYIQEGKIVIEKFMTWKVEN